MPGLVTRNFRHYNADQFKEAFDEAAPSNIYLYIGRTHSWDDESNPPAPLDNVQHTKFEVYRNLIAAKRVTTGDVRYAIPRNDWTSGTIYHEYQNKDGDLYANTYYVFTEDYNVYKCLFNSNNAASTVKPTGTSTSTLTTSDGYKWKFMYNVSAADALKFVTTNYIPVKTITSDDGSAQYAVQQAASNGSIDVIDVTNGGSGYINTTSTFASVTNSTVMALDSTNSSGVDNIYNGSNIYIVSGTGSGQLRHIIDYVGTTRTVTTNGAFSVTPTTGSTYYISPRVLVKGDGSTVALAFANVNSSGNVETITVINKGANYSFASMDISANSGSGATAAAYMAPFGGHGSDATRELAGHNIIINTRLTVDDTTFPSNVDFRQLGLLRDPLAAANGTVTSASSLNFMTRLSLTNVSGEYTDDEFVDGGTSGASGRVVSFANTNADSSQGILSLIGTNGTFQNPETITGNTSSVTATISGITNNDIVQFSGDMLYMENRGPIARADDQIEDIKLVIRF